jgi:Phosphotransferase enzyme family
VLHFNSTSIISSLFVVYLSVHPLSTWSGQFEKSFKISGQSAPEMQQLAHWLKSHIPDSSPSDSMGGLIRKSAGNYDVIASNARKACLVHGDFRLDNLVFDPEDPSKILAVLDWELASVGDPLGDLCYFCLGHHLPPTGFLKKMSLLDRGEDPGPNSNRIPDGILSESEIAQIYHTHCISITLREQRLWGPTDPCWQYFLALGLFRAASIASGVYARTCLGNASGVGAVMYRDVVSVLSRAALQLVSGGTSSSSVRRAPAPSSSSSVISAATSSSGSAPMSREPSANCLALLDLLRRFNDTVAIPAEETLITHYMQADGKWPER